MESGPKDLALETRNFTFQTLGLDLNSLVLATQVHGTTLKNVDTTSKGSGAISPLTRLPDADGLFSLAKELPIGVVVADCVPIFFYLPEKKVISIVHSGWRGTLKGIIKRAVEKISTECDSTGEDFFCWIGPAICFDKFEVSEEIIENFQERYGTKNPAIDSEKRKLDLKELIKSDLLNLNIPENQIEVSSDCTFSDPDRFFSYRRDGGPVGHMMAVIAQR